MALRSACVSIGEHAVVECLFLRRPPADTRQITSDSACCFFCVLVSHSSQTPCFSQRCRMLTAAFCILTTAPSHLTRSRHSPPGAFCGIPAAVPSIDFLLHAQASGLVHYLPLPARATAAACLTPSVSQHPMPMSRSPMGASMPFGAAVVSTRLLHELIA